MTDGATQGEFRGWSVLCLWAGVGFLLLSLVGWFALRDFGFLFFGPAMLFGGVANSLAFFVLDRMQSTGRHVGFWRTSRDFRLYREYWRIAPDKGWSRFPLMGAVVCFVLAACLLLSMLHSGSTFFK